MNERWNNLGLATIWQRYHGDGAGDDELRHRLRQLQTGASELNLDPAVVHVAYEIALMEPLDDKQRFALILLVMASLAALQEGSTRLPVIGRQARAPMRRILGALCGDEAVDEVDEICAAIEHLLDSNLAPHVIGRANTDYRPLIFLRPFIYHHRIRQAEVSLAQLIAARLTHDAPDSRMQKKIGAAVEEIGRGLEQNGLVLSAEQRGAVANAAARRLVLVSGGPGTGKTSIILAILRVLVRTGIDPKKIELAAPTGKAAFRMGESIAQGLRVIEKPAAVDRSLIDAGLQPRTIHRLLGFSQDRGRFLYHRNNQLDAAAVIVDESSMLDLTLMERLVSALQSDTRLILLGDADQLPSVAAGAVFRDLVQAANELQAQPDRYHGVCTRLAHSYRMDTSTPAGRAVFRVADAIRSGDDSIAQPNRQDAVALRLRAGELKFAGVELLSGAGQLEDFLDHWYSSRIQAADVDKLCAQTFVEHQGEFDEAARADLQRIFDHMAASRILCFTRVLPAGSERINAALHRRRIDALQASAERDFVPGEPVMVVRNDYERMLFNGDQGVVVRVRRSVARAAPMASFERGGRFVAFQLAALRDCVELCYATTIHKAQGSEFDSVAIVLPDRDIPILTREALYTAVTRGRNCAIMVGKPELLRTGIARGIQRFSGLAEELRSLLGEKS